MPIPVDDVSTLRAYLRGVLANAEHHGEDVQEIILALAGAIISRKDDGAPLEVQRGRTGNLANALRVMIRGNRYAFSYNHTDRCIDMKGGSSQGAVLHKFTNSTPLAEVARIFREL